MLVSVGVTQQPLEREGRGGTGREGERGEGNRKGGREGIR